MLLIIRVKKVVSLMYFSLKNGQVIVSLPVNISLLGSYSELSYYSASTGSPSNVKLIGTSDPFGETLIYPCIS